MPARTIREIRRSHASRDGDGVAIQRISGLQHSAMDPILLIDELRASDPEDYIGGFPTHPHRGMQTLTYVRHGSISHQDSAGNRGKVHAGGVQWMSAGSGVLHSEMPAADTRGLHAFQLWINLPAAQKMSAPRYRDLEGAALPVLGGDGALARAIAGDWFLASGESLTGPLVELAERAAIMDLELAADTSTTLLLPAHENCLAYVYDGSLRTGGREVASAELLISGPGDALTLSATDRGASLLVLRGRPLGEPVASHGPFVMNTAQEIEQAIRDYRSGTLVRAAGATTGSTA